MAEYLEAVKRYMRVDGDEDDGVIAALYEAAVLYLKNAGVRETEASLPLHYYDHRDAVGSEAEIPVGLRPVLNQLKLTAAIQGDID
jgi:hypothetical protein